MKVKVWVTSWSVSLAAASWLACGQNSMDPCDKLINKVITCRGLDSTSAGSEDNLRASCAQSLEQQNPACQDAFASWVDCVDAIPDPVLTERLAAKRRTAYKKTGVDNFNEDACAVETKKLARLCRNTPFSGQL